MLELEESLKGFLRVPNLLSVSNGTVALQFAIRALGLRDEVITTPFSYVATVSSLVWEGCEPVFVDIEPETLTIDTTKIRSRITERTTGILATHVYGNPCFVEEIEAIAEECGISVIYDAAHCFGVDYKGKSILEWGNISTLSFHATKLFHTGEGGAVVTKDEDLLKEMHYLHNFGHEGPDAFHGLGINGKVSELSAAMGLSILPYVPQIIERRKAVVERYKSNLENSEIKCQKIRTGTEWNYSYLPVILPSEPDLTRSMSQLAAFDIHPRRYFYPSLNKLPYVVPQNCPIAEEVSQRIVCLPLFDTLDADTVDQICEILVGKG